MSPVAFAARGPVPLNQGIGLQAGLAAFYSMQDTNWLDEVAGNTLSVSGSAPSNSGAIVGNGAVFSAAGYLLRADNPGINLTGVSFSVSGWFFGGITAAHMVSKFTGTNGFVMTTTGGNRFRFTVVANNETINADCNIFGAVADNTWYHVVGTYDAVTKIATVSVNGIQSDRSATGTQTLTDTAELNIGRNQISTTLAAGIIDQVGIWKGRVLSQSDQAMLYNNFAGRTYAQML